MRKKQKDWKIKSFSLSNTSIEKLDNICNYLKLNNSEAMEYLINQWFDSLNPDSKYKSLKEQRENLNKKLKKIDTEMSKSLEEIEKFNEWNKQKKSKKPMAIRVIRRKIEEKDLEQAERMAKTWSVILGVPPIELLYEAKNRQNEVYTGV